MKRREELRTGTWSNRQTAPPLSLDVLRAAHQRLTICGLCGRRVERSQRALIVGDRIVHKTCEEL